VRLHRDHVLYELIDSDLGALVKARRFVCLEYARRVVVPGPGKWNARSHSLRGFPPRNLVSSTAAECNPSDGDETMLLFQENFSDPVALMNDWIVAPGMSVRNSALLFAPDHDKGLCTGVTRRNDFRDFSLTADVRIVRSAAAFVLRARAPDEYYMVQFDLANDPTVVWFHTFTPSADEGYRLERVPSAHVPKAGVWHRMRVVARDNEFEVLLGEAGGELQHCASWQDRERTHRQGAVGFWEHGGEAGEYRRLRVDALPDVIA